MANYSLYGTNSDWSPNNTTAYSGYKFPLEIDVPQQFGGPAKRNVARLFDDAFREVALCARKPACDNHFGGLGGGLRLSAMLREWKFRFWCFAPEGMQGRWPEDDKGVTFAQVIRAYPATKLVEIAVHLCALRSPEFLAATLLHEFAHVAGAPGASADDLARHARGELNAADFRRLHKAEQAVYVCGYRAPLYKESVIGALDTIIGRPRRIT
jgi:hypothetical protein